MALNLYSSQDVLRTTREAFRRLRLTQGWTQEALSERAGVSLGSLKRFERTGLIAYDGLLRLALALGCLDRFYDLAAGLADTAAPRSLDDLLTVPPTPKRGRRK